MSEIVENFKFVFEKNGCFVLLERDAKIVKVIWYGKVDLETASAILTRGADLVEEGLADKLLLNRRELIEFDKEARNWIKEDLLKVRAKRIVHLVDKVATINSKTTLGNLFATVVSTAIRLFYPSLRMSSFETEEDAASWLYA